MIHDQDLVDRLSGFPTERFDQTVFRATGISVDPLAPSINGGRWAPAPNRDPGIYVLYTSLARDGAIAEVVSFLADLTPIPGPRPIKVTRLAVTTARTLHLARTDLEGLGVDLSRYGERDYVVTQKIGGALAFLGLDGLLAPSARWPCDNLVIFMDNHQLTERLDALDSEEVEWRSWARDHGFIGK
jgi:RES domain